MHKTETIFDILNQKSQKAILTQLAAVKEWDLDLVNEQGQSPLHVAVMKNQRAVVACLLGKGYSPSQRDQTQLSPFIAAAANGFDGVFELILSFSPDLKQVNRFGGTTLHPSAEKGFISVVQKALAAGVPADEKNRLSWTPLLEAVILGNEGFLYRDMVLELVQASANPQVTDDYGLDSIAYAKQLNHTTIEQLLRHPLLEDEFTAIRQSLRQGKNNEALAQLSQLPSNLETTYYLGRTYEQLGDEESATYYYEKGFETSAEFAYYLANLAKKQGDHAKAQSYFEQGIQSKDTTFYLYHYSNYLREVGKHEEAIQVMDRLLEKNPERVDYMFHKANSLRSIAQHQAAYAVMEEAHRIQPNNSLYTEHMAQSKRLLEKM